MLKFILILLCFISLIFSEIQWQVTTQDISVGQTMRLDVYSSEPISSSKVFFAGRNFLLSFVKDSVLKNELYHYVAFLGLSRKKKSGAYPVYMKFKLKDEVFKASFFVEADHGHIRKGNVVLSQKKQKLMKRRQTLKNEATEILAAFSVVSDQPFFLEQPFILPVKGRVSSKFAANRLYSGGRTSSHAGVDLVNHIGSEIVAPNAGRVILSESYDYHGETIMLDHGFGIVSIFNHLQRRDVLVGDVVKQGQVLGTLGDSGVVSGAHLHWGLAVHNIRVDPLFWINNRDMARSF